jgi:hypothetical protein
MKLTTIMSFSDEMQKLASHGLELAGLGILAAPAVKHLVTGKEMKEKNKSRSEIAGLGTLAAGTLKTMLTKKAASLWNPEVDKVTDMHTRGSVIAKNRSAPAIPKPLKSAAGITGSKLPGKLPGGMLNKAVGMLGHK